MLVRVINGRTRSENGGGMDGVSAADEEELVRLLCYTAPPPAHAPKNPHLPLVRDRRASCAIRGGNGRTK